MLGTTPLDLGLIAVVCIALTSGPTVGLLGRDARGLAQDALGGGIIASKGAIIGIGAWPTPSSGSPWGRPARSSS